MHESVDSACRSRADRACVVEKSNGLFAGSLRAGQRAAAVMSLLQPGCLARVLTLKEDKNAVQVSAGTPESVRHRAAQLYDVAFGSKSSLAVPDKKRRIDLLAKGLVLEHSISAIANGDLVGLAGFSTSDGSLTGGIEYRSLLSDLGFVGGNRAAAVFSLYDRQSREGELLMDGIVVDASCRGQGIGTRLFSCLIELARERGYSTIRLDVIDTNPGARRLYERLGFVAESTERFEFLRWLLGFGASTTMIYSLQDEQPLSSS